jgi:methyltransferase (TIGR00027 family)
MSALPNISDTARWVAVYRATESARPDALFRDPFADTLAGERGRQIARSMSRWMRRNSSWPMVMRTRAIDDLVATCVAEGCDRVLNLAAGLDTRPYRLPLPGTLTWVEADLPAMIEEKERALGAATPACKLVREKVDLADAAARGAFLDRALDGAKRALVITEGLLVYLDPEAVAEVARDLAARGAITWWITDLASPAIVRMLKRQTKGKLGASAQFKFGPAEGVSFFAPLGWKAREVRSLFRDAARFKRLPWIYRLFAFFPDPPATKPGQRPWSAVIRLARA